jgi:hypothetical protein
MSISSVPYKKKRQEPKNIAGVPPIPKVPKLHPERPPPHIPIPGEPTPGGQGEIYKCQVCGVIFTSEEELRLHMATDHPKAKGFQK